MGVIHYRRTMSRTDSRRQPCSGYSESAPHTASGTVQLAPANIPGQVGSRGNHGSQ
jgi:hypothetical protein